MYLYCYISVVQLWYARSLMTHDMYMLEVLFYINCTLLNRGNWEGHDGEPPAHN